MKILSLEVTSNVNAIQFLFVKLSVEPITY